MDFSHLIIDCQYGSTGKGLLAGYLASRSNPDVIAYAPSPNAGHTLLWRGVAFMHKMLPTGFTSDALRAVVLGPGSLLDLDILHNEIRNLRQQINRFKQCTIYIHANAAVVLRRHRAAEADGGTAPGSTRQGVGAAQAERIQRGSGSRNLVQHHLDHPVFENSLVEVVDTARMQQIYLDSERLQIESCQGYGLSIYHGSYPHVTSRDVTTASILADVGAPWGISPIVYGSFRLYPIRVANRDESGEWSGPCYPDSREISFADIGQPQELTTVTKLPRRIFTWSQQQAIEACVQNKVQFAFLNFANYAASYKDLHDVWERLNEATMVRHMGFGPDLSDVYKVSIPALSRRYIETIYDEHR
jgi:adenylosuccinate synthase